MEGREAIVEPQAHQVARQGPPIRRSEATRIRLSEVTIFSDLDPPEIARLRELVPNRAYPVGSFVYTPHQPYRVLYLLLQGRIRIFRVLESGRELTTAVVQPGSMFGEMILLGRDKHQSFAEALQDSVVGVVTKADMERLMVDHRIAARIAETVATRLDDLARALEDSVFKSAPERVAGALLRLAAAPTGMPPRRRIDADLMVTHEQLAGIAAVSRETTTKILGDFSDQGLIALHRGRITVQDRGLLVAASGR